MPRRSFRKILPLLIALCLLSSGIAPANLSCDSECCARPKVHASHGEARTDSTGVLPGCCSGPDTPPCPHMLESTGEPEEYTLATVAAEVNPLLVEIAAVSKDTLVPPQSCPLAAVIRRPHIRGPGVPIFLLTRTFLI